MIFAVRPEAMNGTEAVLNRLDSLLGRVEDEIHELEIADADLLENTGWYQVCRPNRRKMLEKCAAAMLYRTPRTRGPHLRRTEVCDETTALAAHSLAHTPLLILVENLESDGALVKYAVKALATRTAWELCFGAGTLRTPPAFRIESPGGHGELPKLLSARLKEAAVRNIAPRILVMTDSDGELVGDVKAAAQGIRMDCSNAGVPCPPLNKRTAENYIPDAVWLAWAAEPQHTKARPAVEALLRLSRDQRDYVNIGPANHDPWNSLNPDAATLFASVSAQDQGLLKAANLKGRRFLGIASILELHGSASTPADIQTRDHAGDLEALVRRIEDEL